MNPILPISIPPIWCPFAKHRASNHHRDGQGPGCAGEMLVPAGNLHRWQRARQVPASMAGAVIDLCRCARLPLAALQSARGIKRQPRDIGKAKTNFLTSGHRGQHWSMARRRRSSRPAPVGLADQDHAWRNGHAVVSGHANPDRAGCSVGDPSFPSLSEGPRANSKSFAGSGPTTAGSWAFNGCATFGYDPAIYFSPLPIGLLLPLNLAMNKPCSPLPSCVWQPLPCSNPPKGQAMILAPKAALSGKSDRPDERVEADHGKPVRIGRRRPPF